LFKEEGGGGRREEEEKRKEMKLNQSALLQHPGKAN
jgi:hypothetical protein